MCPMEKVGSIVNSISLRQVYRNTAYVCFFFSLTYPRIFSLLSFQAPIYQLDTKTKNDILCFDFDLLRRYFPRSHEIQIQEYKDISKNHILKKEVKKFRMEVSQFSRRQSFTHIIGSIYCLR